MKLQQQVSKTVKKVQQEQSRYEKDMSKLHKNKEIIASPIKMPTSRAHKELDSWLCTQDDLTSLPVRKSSDDDHDKHDKHGKYHDNIDMHNRSHAHIPLIE